MTAWGRVLYDAMNGFADDRETGLVRMFRTEYNKEYSWMKKNGVAITEGFVKAFLAERR